MECVVRDLAYTLDKAANTKPEWDRPLRTVPLFTSIYRRRATINTMIAALSSTSGLSNAQVFTSGRQSNNVSRGVLQVGFPCQQTFRKGYMS